MSDKTSQLIPGTNDKMTRAEFMTRLLAASAGFGLLSGFRDLDVFAHSPVQDSFVKRLDRFAGRVKLRRASTPPKNYLATMEKKIQEEVDRRLKAILEKGYDQRLNSLYAREDTGITQITIFFVPLQRDVKNPLKFIAPFFNSDPNAKEIFSSALSTPTLYGLPDVAEDLEKTKGLGPEELYGNLVPLAPRDMSYNEYQFPDTYYTNRGAVRVEYKPEGELGTGLIWYDVTTTINPKSGKTESLLYTGRERGRGYPANNFAGE